MVGKEQIRKVKKGMRAEWPCATCRGVAKGGSRGGPDPYNIMFVGKTWTSVGIFNVWI